MNLNNLNLITVLLVLLQVFNVINISWWIVFAPSIVWLAIFILVLAMALTIMIANGMSIAEFNKLMEENKKNK